VVRFSFQCKHHTYKLTNQNTWSHCTVIVKNRIRVGHAGRLSDIHPGINHRCAQILFEKTSVRKNNHSFLNAHIDLCHREQQPASFPVSTHIFLKFYSNMIYVIYTWVAFVESKITVSLIQFVLLCLIF
jgi:hypothetical protein